MPMREAFPSQLKAPVCPGPDANPSGTTRYFVPAGAVDTHAHVIGTEPTFRFVEPRSYTPLEAKPSDYLSMLDATGMAYGVLIQVSVHGTDNSLLVRTLRQNSKRLRGIAVIPLNLADSELRGLKEAGIVGVRLNSLYGGGIGFAEVASYASLCAELNWHLQFLIDARDLPPIAGKLSRLPVPFVVDHMGHFPTSVGLKNAGFQALLGLIADGGWVKLQGAFRNSVAGPPYTDTIPFAQALNDAAPDRCIWGSDWPHVATWNGMPRMADLLDLVAEWVPDIYRRNRLFVDNPHRLYGFRLPANAAYE